MIKRTSTNWTVKRMVKLWEKGEITFDNVVQRNYVWDNARKSLLIHSVLTGYPVPSLYVVKTEDSCNDMLDGKQRCEAFKSFKEDGFELTDVQEVAVETEDGEVVVYDLNGRTFSTLPEDMQDTVNDFVLSINCFENCITDEEIHEMFFRLNNGKPLSAIELTRVRAKSMNMIKEIAEHDLFKNALTEKALARYTNEDIVIKSWVMLNETEPSLATKDIRSIMEKADLTQKDAKELKEIYDRVMDVHNILLERENKRAAKRIVTRTHMISVVPFVKESLERKISEEGFANWFEQFFCGTRSATNCIPYNSATGSGSAKKESVKKRHLALKKDFDSFFSNYAAKEAYKKENGSLKTTEAETLDEELEETAKKILNVN